jgi:AraC-like DNA-binding protein
MRDILVIDCKGREHFWTNLESDNRILFAANISEGLNLLSENVGLVFLNLDGKGVEMRKLIKKAYPSTEVVIITSCDKEGPCNEAPRSGARNNSERPLNADDILQKIRSLIGTDDVFKGYQQPFLSNETDDTNHLSSAHSNLASGVLKVRDFIVQNHSESITLDEACKMASTSKTYFCRCFKCITGHSLRNYHHVVKVEKAEKLLRDRRFSIADVATKLGYSDSNYFSIIYKKITGVSPRQRSRPGKYQTKA